MEFIDKYPIVNISEFKVLDITKKLNLSGKLKFIKKYFNRLLLNDGIDGILIYREIKKEEFERLRNEIQFKVLFIYGNLIVEQYSVSIVHNLITSWFSDSIQNYIRVNNIKFIETANENNKLIYLPNGNCLQCDEGLLIRKDGGREEEQEEEQSTETTMETTTTAKRNNGNSTTKIIFESFIYHSIEASIIKARLYFQNPLISTVIIIKLYQREPEDSNKFKAVTLLFNREYSIFSPSKIISFGSKSTTIQDENYFSALSKQVGALSHNKQLNIHPNNSIFIINIPQKNNQDIQLDLLLLKNNINNLSDFKKAL